MAIISPTTIADLSWFVGICDGEACFSMRDDQTRQRRLRPRFAVLMEEKRALFEQMKAILGCGRIDSLPPKPRKGGGFYNSRFTLMAESKEDLAGVCQFFSVHRLRSHKAREFEIWSRLVHMWVKGQSSTLEVLQGAIELTDVANRRKGQSSSFRRKLSGWLASKIAEGTTETAR